MRKLVKNEDLQQQQNSMMKKFTKKIVSKSRSVRGLEDAADEEAADDAVEEEAEYYDAAEEVAADDAAADDAAADDAAAVAATTDDAVTADDSVSNRKKSNNAWGQDDDYDYSGLVDFDMSLFSIKLHSCRSLTNFELDDIAEMEEEAAQQREEGNNGFNEEDVEGVVYPFTATPFVNFRLCPTDTCQDDSWEGCRNVYGNYLVPLEDYLQATQEHLEEEKESYCDYCNQCAYFYKYFNAQCEYYDECQTYADVCVESDDDNDDALEVNYEDYMECTAVDRAYYNQYYNVAYQNGNENYENRRTEEAEDKVYLKIFCSDTIKIGIFSDEDCTNYIGQQTTIKKATSLEMYEDDLETNFMQRSCHSCSKSRTKYYFKDQDQYNEQQEKDDDEEEEDELYEICEQLYEDSAKCNAQLPYQSKVYYGEDDEVDAEWYETQDATTCSFLEAVQKGNIDKYGFVHLSFNKYLSKYINKFNNDYLPEQMYVTDGQFFAIVSLSILLVAAVVYGVAFKPRKESVQTIELKTNLV